VAKLINSQALEPLNKVLGLAGSGDSQTELIDGTVDQVLDVAPVVRRGGTAAGTGGIFRIALRTVHGAANEKAVSFQPYQPGSVGVVAPYPNPVPDTFDFWILQASCERVSGAGDLVGAQIRLTQVIQGFGLQDNATAFTSTAVMQLAAFGPVNASTDVEFFPVLGTGECVARIGLRVPRKGVIASPFIVFDAVSDGIVTIDCVMLCALFPLALGQDVAV